MTEEIDPRKLAEQKRSLSESLLQNRAFEWFLAECIDARMTELDVILHDRKKTSDERDKALERWTELRDTRLWVKEQNEIARRALAREAD